MAWHSVAISENAVCDRFFRNFGREIFLKLEEMGKKNHLQSNRTYLNHADLTYPDSIPANLKNIEPKNQHDLADSCSLQKIMLWGSHYLRTSTIYVISQASTFSMRIPMAHNNMSSVHTHSMVPVPHYQKIH